MAKVKVKIGDHISFKRKGMDFKGVVEIVRDNSVIAAISSESAQLLDYETTKTVVKHSNYQILKEAVSA